MTRSALFRSLNLAVMLVASGLLAVQPAAAQFGKNRIQYREFDWKIYHSPHFDVYYYTAEEHQLKTVVSFAESAYDELSRFFDFQIQEPTPLIIYQTHSAFQQQNVIVNGVPEGVQAFATPSRFRMLMPIDLPDPELLALIKHELTHIFQYHILFRGRFGAGLRGAPPTWFIEGMASYVGDDEDDSDKKYIRDAVVNDNIPPIEWEGGGFFAYRFGHAVFEFIEERWGKEGVLDLMYEMRSTIGSRIGKAIERAFRMDAEDFDTELRRWLRQRYLPRLLETGEPGDFGRPFRLEETSFGQEVSPAASPSGDLVAAITTDKQEVDVSLFDTQKRRRIKVLTKGIDTQTRGIFAGAFYTGRGGGGDLAFSPDGNQVAAFASREAGRSLILIDVINGGINKIIEMDVEQQRSPAWSTDGRSIAFSGNLNGWFDIFTVDLETLEITNITSDERFDVSPAYSPDGKWLAYASFVGEQAQLFRLDLADPSQRYQLTNDESSNREPVFSPSGKRIYFTSNRSGADNIYGLDLDTGKLTQYTNAVTACERPTVLPLPDGGERLVYNGYWKGTYDLYMTDVEEPIGETTMLPLPQGPAVLTELPVFEPDIEVTIDEENVGPYRGRKLFLEDAQSLFGVTSDQIFVGRLVLSFTNYLGDRRFIADVAAVDSISDFDLAYVNLKNRWQWSARIYDRRLFRTFRNPVEPDRVERDQALQYTGANFSVIYPLSFHRRFEIGASYLYRDFDVFGTFASTAGTLFPFIPRSDDYPEISAAFVSDTTIFNPWGAISGHRVRLSASYAPDLDESGSLATTVSLDARKYIPLTRRSNMAFRAVGFSSSGNFPDFISLGGLDTIRGFGIYEFSGHRGFYGNAEIRFPLIDQLSFPFLQFQGVRGVLFFDVAATWFENDSFRFYDSDLGQLEDAIAAYGWGLTARFLGLNLNWDFAQRTRFADEEESDFVSTFWIGTRF